MLRLCNLYVIAIIILIGFFYSCEKDAINSISEPLIKEQSVSEIIQDTIFSDSELQKILEEELAFIKLEKQGTKGTITDISDMDIVKTNPKKIYVHYMPWFQSKEYDGYWGQHWTMNNQNPDIQDEHGTRQIASYYYPLIGPYSSGDPDLQEYHLLLMKLSGIDGVIFDWYGKTDLYDYDLIKKSTETFIDNLEDLGLTFSIMYEDRIIKQVMEESLSKSAIEIAQEDFKYINDTYFSSPDYLKYNDKNMLFIFGPNYLTTETEWNQVFDILPTDNRPNFLTLWGASGHVGANASGEFLWVDQDHLLAHEHYYDTYQPENNITVGSSYPGFKSFYTKGGWIESTNDWTIDFAKGQTFVETLNYTHHELSDFIQIITWNDFGEGTMIEPTQEFGFTYLQILQQYTGVPFEANHLKIVLELYRTRKEYKNNKQVQQLLDRTYKYIKKHKPWRAKRILRLVRRFF